MPTLNWIGKEKVINFHQKVPYRFLERKYTYNKEDGQSENMIIHGDNLEVLKSLLPKFEGRIKCIYIDPPYNTGNEGWVYNDNVNDPKLKAWLGKVVGAEAEDLSRHDKWLCMMYPRLILLRKLLAEDGIIFVSIDDNELYYLKMVCDEIFGSDCFVSNVSWQRTYSQRNDSKGIANEVEHILVYSKQSSWQPEKLSRTEGMDAKYKNPDGDKKGKWRNIIASAPSASTHQGMVYAIQNPFTGECVYPPTGRCWPFQQSQMLNIMNEWCDYELRDINDAKKRANVCGISEENIKQDVKGILLSNDFEISRIKAQKRYDEGNWPELYFTKAGKGTLSRKAYLEKVGGRSVTNFWSYNEVGHTDEAARLLKSIFSNNTKFDTPKPPRLVERILEIVSGKDFYVLDSFAGSGSTAHAVLNKNKQDDGKRKFILIEMEDYVESVTAERVKRVIAGYGEGKTEVSGLGGSFSYYEMGDTLFDDKGNINDLVSIKKIKEYIWFMETRDISSFLYNDKSALLGVNRNTAYYFLYDKQKITTLDFDFLTTINEKQDAYVIYADVCTISELDLIKWNITFKKIPRDISKL